MHIDDPPPTTNALTRNSRALSLKKLTLQFESDLAKRQVSISPEVKNLVEAFITSQNKIA